MTSPLARLKLGVTRNWKKTAFILVAYTAYSAVPPNSDQTVLRSWWPNALAARIDNAAARTLHISFKQKPIAAAVDQFDFNKMPNWPLTFYSREEYVKWGILQA